MTGGTTRRLVLLGAALCVAACSGADDGGGDGDDRAAQDGDGAGAGGDGDGGRIGGEVSGDGGGGEAPGDAGAMAEGDGGGPPMSMACPDGTNHLGGTRVQRRLLVTEEGDRAFHDHFDVQRGAPCEFNTASDGELRCLPNNWSNSETFYLDASCTMPVHTEALQGPCEPMGLVMILTEPGSCVARGYDFFELGDEVAQDSPLYVDSGGSCMEASGRPDEPLYRRGAGIPPGTFPRAEETGMGSDGRLEAYGALSEDGAFRVYGWRDAELGDASCQMRRAEDGELRCIPYGRRIDRNDRTLYADAACTMPLLSHGGQCDPPDYGTEFPDLACDDDPHRAWRVGPVHTGAAYGMAGTCAPREAPMDAVLHGMTRLAPDELARVQMRTDASDGGRLQRRHLVSDAGGCWAAAHWDSELQAPCRFRMAADGRWRCLPEAWLPTRVGFSDPACTVPAAYASVPECETPAELPELITDIRRDDCRTGYVYEVGDRVAGDALELYEDNGQGCAAARIGLPSTWRELTPVDPARFMAAEVRTP